MLRVLLTGTLFLGTASLLLTELPHIPDGALHFHMLDVGQGDAFLVVTPTGKHILIDGGPDATVLRRLKNHMSHFNRTIDLMVLTHADADHITGLTAVLKRYAVKRVLLTGRIHASSRYELLVRTLQQKGIPVLRAHPDTDIIVEDGVILDVLWPPRTGALSSNNASVVLRLLWNNHSLLVTGDIEEEAERAILAQGHDVSASILTVPHHGSRTSSSTGFLVAVKPALALVSAGKENRFAHPHRDIIERYRHLGIPVHSTQQEGTVSLTVR